MEESEFQDYGWSDLEDDLKELEDLLLEDLASPVNKGKAWELINYDDINWQVGIKQNKGKDWYKISFETDDLEDMSKHIHKSKGLINDYSIEVIPSEVNEDQGEECSCICHVKYCSRCIKTHNAIFPVNSLDSTIKIVLSEFRLKASEIGFTLSPHQGAELEDWFESKLRELGGKK